MTDTPVYIRERGGGRRGGCGIRSAISDVIHTWIRQSRGLGQNLPVGVAQKQALKKKKRRGEKKKKISEKETLGTQQCDTTHTNTAKSNGTRLSCKGQPQQAQRIAKGQWHTEPA